MKKRLLRFVIATFCCLFITTTNGSDSPTGQSTTFWGGVDYRDFGEINLPPSEASWDHKWVGAQVGFDIHVADNLLAGAAMSWSQSDIDYFDVGGFTLTRVDLDLVGVQPYIIWSAQDKRLDWWATVGGGKGDGNFDVPVEIRYYDYDLTTAWFGVSRLLLLRSNTEWRLKGDARHARLEVEYGCDDNACFPSGFKTDSNRLRMALEAKRSNFTVAGTKLQPAMQVGVRYYGGNQSDGASVEIDSMLRYQNTAHGLTLDGRAWALDGVSGDEENNEQWSISATLRLARTNWRGLSFALTSAYGSRTNRHRHDAWREGWPNFLDRNPRAWMYVHIAYGLTPHPVWTDCPRLRAGC